MGASALGPAWVVLLSHGVVQTANTRGRAVYNDPHPRGLARPGALSVMCDPRQGARQGALQDVVHGVRQGVVHSATTGPVRQGGVRRSLSIHTQEKQTWSWPSSSSLRVSGSMPNMGASSAAGEPRPPSFPAGPCFLGLRALGIRLTSSLNEIGF